MAQETMGLYSFLLAPTWVAWRKTKLKLFLLRFHVWSNALLWNTRTVRGMTPPENTLVLKWLPQNDILGKSVLNMFFISVCVCGFFLCFWLTLYHQSIKWQFIQLGTVNTNLTTPLQQLRKIGSSPQFIFSQIQIQIQIQNFISITIHQNQNITKHSVQQKDKEVMEEKAERPKMPDNSLPLQCLITNKNKFVKKTNKQTDRQTNNWDNYETRQGTMLKKD